MYESLSEDLGGFREVLTRGCFDHLLSGRKLDVVALWNHESSGLLGRTTNDTLRLWSDEKGLRYEVTLPDTNLANDLRKLVARGDINSSSFAFTVSEDDYETEKSEGGPVRRIRKIRSLHDVSLVTTPAYQATTVSLRSFKAWQDSQAEAQLVYAMRAQEVAKAEAFRLQILALTEG